jgi:hypothetical protein
MTCCWWEGKIGQDEAMGSGSGAVKDIIPLVSSYLMYAGGTTQQV